MSDSVSSNGGSREYSILFGIVGVQIDLLDKEQVLRAFDQSNPGQGILNSPEGHNSFGLNADESAEVLRVLTRKLRKWSGNPAQALADLKSGSELASRSFPIDSHFLAAFRVSNQTLRPGIGILPRYKHCRDLVHSFARGLVRDRHRLINGLAAVIAVAVVTVVAVLFLFPGPDGSFPGGSDAGQTGRRSTDRSALTAQSYADSLQLARSAILDCKIDRAREILMDLAPASPGYRDDLGFEWLFHWRLLESQAAILRGHSSPVMAVAFSPNGKILATGGKDGRLCLWDAQVAGLIQTTECGTPITSITYHRDGGRLAVGGEDGTITMVDAASGDSKKRRVSSQPICTVQFGSEGKDVALAGMDKIVQVWDDQLMRRLHTLNLESEVRTLAYSPSGKTLAVGSSGGNLFVWSPGGVPLPVKGHESGKGREVTSLAFSADDRWLAVALTDNAIRLHDLLSGRVTRVLDRHTAMVTGLSFTPDSRRLASASLDGNLRIWHVREGTELLAFKTKQLTSAAFDVNGLALAAGSTDTTIKLIQVSSPEPEKAIPREASRFTDVLFIKLGTREDVADAIKRNPTLSDALKRAALERVANHPEDPMRLNQASWLVARVPGKTKDQYHRALRQAQEACRLRPNDGYMLNTLGVVQYRLENFNDALVTLSRSKEINSASPTGTHPADLAFLILAYHKLGQKSEIDGLLGQLRKLMQGRWKNDEESQGFWREVREALKLPADPTTSGIGPTAV